MVTVDITSKLHDLGHEVYLLCRDNSKLFEEAIKKGIKAFPILENNTGLLHSILKLNNLLKNNHFDVIHTHLSHDLWTMVPAMKLSHSKARLFLTKHMGSSVRKKDIFHKYLYNKVDCIFAVSNYVKDSILHTCPVDQRRVSVLHDAISVSLFNKNKYDKTLTRKEFKLPENCIIIGMVGRITPGKGHEDLLEAIKIIEEKTNKQIYFLIAGGASYGEEKYEEKIHALASELKILDKVIFIGFQKDVAKIMSIMDILVFPSHLESFGITLLEAMAMELPIIASNNAGIPDIIKDGETGILIPPKDPTALSGAIIKLAGDLRLCKKLGAAGRKRVEESFNLDINILQLEKYYKNQQ